MQGGETVVVPAIALAASCYLLYNAFSADSSVWLGERGECVQRGKVPAVCLCFIR